MRPLWVLFLASAALVLAADSGVRDLILQSVRRKDIRTLGPAVNSYFMSKPRLEESSLVVLSCLRSLNENVTPRVVRMGVSFLSSLDPVVVPPQELQLGVLGLEMLVMSAGHSSVLPELQSLLGASPSSDLVSLPSSRHFRQLSLSSPWLPWNNVARLRLSLLQLPPRQFYEREASTAALAMIEAIRDDRRCELLLASLLQAVSENQHSEAITATTVALGCAARSVVGNNELFVASVRWLDILCGIGGENTNFVKGDCDGDGDGDRDGDGDSLAASLGFIRGRLNGLDSRRPQLSMSWARCRESPVLRAALVEAETARCSSWGIADIVAAAAGSGLVEGSRGLFCLCLGEGDMAASLAIARALLSPQPTPSSSTSAAERPLVRFLCATSILSQESFRRLYTTSGPANVEELLAINADGLGCVGSTAALFAIDATCPVSWQTCLSALNSKFPTEGSSPLRYNCLVFNFPFGDQQLAPSGSGSGSGSGASFDTRYMAKGRHQELLEGVFRCADAVLDKACPSSGGDAPHSVSASAAVIITVLLHQAVSWDLEHIAAAVGFELYRARPFDRASYPSRRSNVDAGFAAGSAEGWSRPWSFEFRRSNE